MSNVERVRQLYAAFATGDMEQVLGAMDPQIEWREAEGNPYEPSGTVWIGPDAVVQNLMIHLGTDWDGFTVHPKEFHGWRRRGPSVVASDCSNRSRPGRSVAKRVDISPA